MDDEELTRLAEEEILKETKRLAERAAVYGALGWMKCPLRPTNKQFLVNTILPTLSTNRKYRHEDRRDYYRTDESLNCRVFNFDDRYSSSERHNHRSKRESDSEGKSSHSHKDSKDLHRGSRDRHNKNKSYSPAHKSKLSGSSSVDNNRKESNTYGTENKTTDSKTNSDEHKEHDYTHHKNSKDNYHASSSRKSYKDDKYVHKRSDSAHHYKKHDDYTSAEKYNDDRDNKIEASERHAKSRTDERPKVKNKSQHSVGIELENYKDKRGNSSYRIPDSSGKYKHGESAIKHSKVKDELVSSTANERFGHSKSITLHNKDIKTVTENISKSERDQDGKNNSYKSEHLDQDSSGDVSSKKRKASRRKKKRKRKKLGDSNDSDEQKAKKRRRTSLTAETDNFQTKLDKGINIENKIGNKPKNLKYDVQNDTDYKSTKDKFEVEQENGAQSRESIKYFEKNQLVDPKYRQQERERKQNVTKNSRRQKNEVDALKNAKPGTQKLKKAVKSFVTEENNKNYRKYDDSDTHDIRETKTMSKSHDNNYLCTGDQNKEVVKKWNNESKHDGRNSSYSRKDNTKCRTSENNDSTELCHTKSRSSRDTEYVHVKNNHEHQREKSDCLRDITDEMWHRGTENSKRSKRERWSIESD